MRPASQTQYTRKKFQSMGNLDKGCLVKSLLYFLANPMCLISQHGPPQAWRRQARVVLQLPAEMFLVAAARFLCTFSNHCIFIHLDSTLFTDKNTEDPRGFLICLSHSFISLRRMVSIECIFCVGQSPSFWRWCDKQDRLHEGPHSFGLPSQSY